MTELSADMGIPITGLIQSQKGGIPTAYVISKNIHRRNMTKGQRAMAVALIYPEPEKGGRGKKSGNSKENLGFSTMLLSNARTVLQYAKDHVRDVMSGAMPLDEAY